MTPSLADRKGIELEQKLAELETEFLEWLSISKAGELFEKHQTQILVITSGLHEFAAGIRSELDTARGDKHVLSAAQNVESMILAVRRVWEYFRSKWVQRRVERFRNYLGAADELTWSFYEPVLRHRCPTPVSPCRREPPLVFLNGGISPFAVARDKAFQAEEVIGEMLPEDKKLRKYLRQLPIPVIGVPWYQIRHLPDALVLAHETGHAVQGDFNIGDELAQKFSLISSAWTAWESEVFADLFGCLVMGPPFVGTLIDFLSGDHTEIERESRSAPDWGHYPTAALRIFLCIAAMNVLGFDSEAEALNALWVSEYASHALVTYETNFDAIIAATLASPLDSLDCALVDIPNLRFTKDQLKEAKQTAESLASGSVPETTSIRVLFAGARVLFESDPRAMQTSDPKKDPRVFMLKRFEQIVQPGTRDGEPRLDDEQLKLLYNQSKALGQMLFEEARK